MTADQTVHLKYGGSTAARTLGCPAWLNLAEAAPKIDRTSPAAERGTKLHKFMEDNYNEVPAAEFVRLAKELPEDECEAVLGAARQVEALFDQYEASDFFVECFTQIPGTAIGGTVDLLIYSDDHVVLVDYKFGYAPVTSFDQFRLYHNAMKNDPQYAHLFKTRDYAYAIVQPAVRDTALMQIDESDKYLKDWWQDFLDAVKLSEDGATTGEPGSHCQYCPAALYCPAKLAEVKSFMRLDPAHEKQLASAMDLVASMKAHIKQIESEVFSALEHGLPVPGWKMVPKQSRRYWTDEDAVRHLLRYNKGIQKEGYIEEKLKSPAQVEKAIKAADIPLDLSELIENKSSGNTIAPESDKRDAIVAGAVPEALNKILG